MDAEESTKRTLTRQIDIEYREYPFRLRFYSDGTAAATEMCCGREESEHVDFEWKLNEAEVPRTDEDWAYFAGDIFAESVASQLEDPFLDDADGNDQETYFRTGSEEALRETLELILACLPELFDYLDEDTISLRVSTETEDEGASMELESRGRAPESVMRLLDLALEENTPVGWSWEYNDGLQDRRSGYSHCSNSLEFEILRPSFHRVAVAPRLLASRLEKQTTKCDLQKLIQAARSDLKDSAS